LLVHKIVYTFSMSMIAPIHKDITIVNEGKRCYVAASLFH